MRAQWISAAAGLALAALAPSAALAEESPWSATLYAGPSSTKFVTQILDGEFDVNGGMVGLAFAERYPDRVANLLVIGASDRAHPMASAWRSTQRRMVRFAIAAGQPQQGMELARALAIMEARERVLLGSRRNRPF